MKITRNCFITAGDTAALWICYSVLWWSGDVVNISLTSLEWGTSFGQITLLRRDKWTKKIWSVWLRARKVRIKTRMFLQQEDGWKKWYQSCKWELLKWYYSDDGGGGAEEAPDPGSETTQCHSEIVWYSPQQKTQDRRKIQDHCRVHVWQLDSQWQQQPQHSPEKHQVEILSSEVFLCKQFPKFIFAL